MAKDNLTVFQRLTKVFGQGGPSKSKYALDQQFKQEFEKQLLNTNSKEQAEKDKLQAQQSMYLNDNYFKVDNELYQQAVYYETTRMASYADFEAMEFTPEISAALDIFMEEATTTDEKGKVLAIYSESQRVKQALQELFYDILDIETNLAPWTRNTCKYGDNFIQLRIDPKKGIIGCQQLPNILIERREPGVETQSPYAKNNSSSKNIKFFYKNKDIEFNSWEMAHFRLLGDDRKLPYGTSILEKARRIWKQLILSEDAMLVYRVTRAPERRVFKIFVGNIEDEAIEPYIQKIANKFKRTQVVDPTTGQIDLRMNQLAVDQDYFIPVRDTAAPSPIETLPGASNLDQIADIEYIQRKLFTALRVPKPFLGFEETSGEGKNLAMMDVRFARTINRVQQAMIQELNKIAIIHLYILGFEDDLENFTLGLSNPSTQADILKVEQWKEKVTLYRDLVADAGNGFGASSMTWAKKNILGFSDDEIILDLEQQRIEKAAANEIQNTGTAIPSTGIFDKVDKLYGGIKGADTAAAADTGGEAEGGLETGGAAGGGFGGGETDLGGGETELGGEETGFGGGETGGEAPPAEGGEPLAERTKIITEDVLNGTVFKKKTSVEDRILKASNKVLNEDIKSMIEGIDKLLD